MINWKPKFKVKHISVRCKDDPDPVFTDERMEKLQIMIATYRSRGEEPPAYVPWMGRIIDGGHAANSFNTFPWPYTKTGRMSQAYLREVVPIVMHKIAQARWRRDHEE